MKHTINACAVRSEEVDEEKGDNEDTTQQRNKRRKTQRRQSIHAKALLQTLMSHQHGFVFNAPVDPVELGLPDYFDVVKEPMDLGTIKTKLDGGQYRSYHEFYADVRLTFDNALLYNTEGSPVHPMALELKHVFLTEKAKIKKARRQK